jgi:YfiH family protein
MRGEDAPPDAVFLNQVHGARVVTIKDVVSATSLLDADAVTGNRPGDICCVRTADCLPLLLCAKDGSEVAAIHGGWRGVLAGVIENTVAALNTRPSELLAWLGPAISQPAFEVGGEVRDAYMQRDPHSAVCFAPNEGGRWQADLYGLGRMRLADAGVEAVYGAEWCTFGDSERFHSFRRDPKCGRMVSFIRML